MPSHPNQHRKGSTGKGDTLVFHECFGGSDKISTYNLNIEKLSSTVRRQLNGFDSGGEKIRHGRVGTVARIIMLKGTDGLDLL